MIGIIICTTTLLALSYGESVLEHCEAEVSSSPLLSAEGLLTKKTYLVVDGAADKTVTIRITDKKKNIPVKVQIDCVAGTVKVNSKTGKNWKVLGQGAGVQCKDKEMEIVINLKGKAVWVGDNSDPISLRGSVSGKAPLSLEVSKNVDTLHIANGNCAAYPPSVTTCGAAREYYMKHEQVISGGVYKTGFFKTGFEPRCAADGSYAPLQKFMGNRYACVDGESGAVLGGLFVQNSVENGDVAAACNVA